MRKFTLLTWIFRRQAPQLVWKESPCSGRPDFDPEKIAMKLLNQYGADAEVVAWGMADSEALEGNAAGYRSWLTVLSKIQASDTARAAARGNAF